MREGRSGGGGGVLAGLYDCLPGYVGVGLGLAVSLETLVCRGGDCAIERCLEDGLVLDLVGSHGNSCTNVRGKPLIRYLWALSPSQPLVKTRDIVVEAIGFETSISR